MKIGDWATREHRGMFHLVESIVAKDIVTKCGKRMADTPTKTGGRLTLMPSNLRLTKDCAVCAS